MLASHEWENGVRTTRGDLVLEKWFAGNDNQQSDRWQFETQQSNQEKTFINKDIRDQNKDANIIEPKQSIMALVLLFHPLETRMMKQSIIKKQEKMGGINNWY